MGRIQPANRAQFDDLARGRLAWLEGAGVGFYPVEVGAAPYDLAYFERFAEQAATPIGRALMAARVDFVARRHPFHLVDIGIGSGAFVELRNARLPGSTRGYDVNPAGRQWLDERGLFHDPYADPVEAVSLWDVLEHIPDFRPLLRNVRRFVFLAVPIFRDAAHARSSKHFRPLEHCWYFTRRGLVEIFDGLGFECVEVSDEETTLGREDIESFAFRRVDFRASAR